MSNINTTGSPTPSPHRRIHRIIQHIQSISNNNNNNNNPNSPVIFPTSSASSSSLPLLHHVTAITGSGSGFGRSTAIAFALLGASLALQDIDSNGLKETKRIIDDTIKNSNNQPLIDLHKSPRILLASFDVSDPSATSAWFSSISSAFGRLSSAFINAGVVGHMGDHTTLEVGPFSHTLNINVVGAFLGVKHAASLMKSNPSGHEGGSIILTSSVAGVNSGAGGVDYSASKAAVNSITKTMAYELKGTGIRVNSICPGIFETGMTKVLFDMARQKKTEGKIGQLNPLNRPGQVDEVASLVIFLADKSTSGYINGQCIPIDGGLTASMPTATNKSPGEQIERTQRATKKEQKIHIPRSKREAD